MKWYGRLGSVPQSSDPKVSAATPSAVAAVYTYCSAGRLGFPRRDPYYFTRPVFPKELHLVIE